MKKNYILTICFLLITTFSFSQNRGNRIIATSGKYKIPNSSINKFGSSGIDTIFDHFDNSLVTNYTATNAQQVPIGYVAGHNDYGDKAKLQRFDAQYGVSGPGTITELLFLFFVKSGDTAGTLKASIWNDVNGKPGTIIGTQTFTIADIDTTDFTSIIFTNPVIIPANQIFYAGIEINYTSTGVTGLSTSNDPTSGDAPGLTGDFADAITHTWDQFSDNSYVSFATQPFAWGLDIALAIFPVISTTTGISNQPSELFTGVKNHPNPFNGSTTLDYELKKSVENVIITISDLTGRVVSTYNQTNQTAGKQSVIIDGSELAAGLYNATINADGNSTSIRMIVK